MDLCGDSRPRLSAGRSPAASLPHGKLLDSPDLLAGGSIADPSRCVSWAGMLEKLKGPFFPPSNRVFDETLRAQCGIYRATFAILLQAEGGATEARRVNEQLKRIEEMRMKSKTEAKHTARKKAITKPTTPPKALPAGLHMKEGIWVFSTGEPISHGQTERIRRTIQCERENRWMGIFAKPKAES